VRQASRAVLVCVLLLSVAALTLAAHEVKLSAAALVAEQAGPPVEQGEEQQEAKSPTVREFERQQARAINKQRHDDLKRDTDKLLQLATELKLAVDKSNEHTLSMDVVKKAEEIEKLSKSVQKKMRGY
jgi:nitric oxide reductase activation protein